MITKINFAPGDIVRVFEKIKDVDPSAGHSTLRGEPIRLSSQPKPSGSDSKSSGQVKTRTQVFEGTVLGIRGRGENKSFRVRKLIGDILVERIWPFTSPSIEKVVVKEHPKKKIKRAKLYYLFNTK